MGRIVQDCAPPCIERQRALHETSAQCRGHMGLSIPLCARVIAGDMESRSVQLLEPSLDRDLPIRVLSEEPADDTKADRLPRTWRGWQNGRIVSRSHHAANHRAVQGLKLSIVTALIGQIKRLVPAHRLL